MTRHPAGLSCVWMSVAAGGASGNGSGSGHIDDTSVLPSGGAVTYTATCAIDPSATGTLSNTATVTGSVFDPVPADNTATDGDSVLMPEADLSITADLTPNDPVVGETVFLDAQVSNTGPSDADNVIVNAVLPSGLSFVSTMDCVEDPNGFPVCSLGTLAAGTSVGYRIETVATGSGGLPGDLTVSSDATDPDTTDNSTGSSVGVAMSVDVPSLQGWGFWTLCLLLAGVAVRRLVRQTHQA